MFAMNGKNWSRIVFSYTAPFLLAFLVVAPTIEVLLGNNKGATVLAAVGAAALLLTRLSDVVEFSLWGVKAKLERAIEQAEVTIAQLRSMAVAFAEANLTQIAVAGQSLLRLNTETKFEMRDKIVVSLREIGADDEAVLRIQTVWIQIYSRLLFGLIESKLLMLPGISSATLAEIEKDRDVPIPNPQTLRRFLMAKSIQDAELLELVAEFKNVWTTGSMKKPSLIPFNQAMRGR